ncbi:MAG: T9SS type A sorting domain-containing protein [Bacteroidetes bacterium]|nr:T9SS type A sorting domain-containing protein [Bacteroidota bacterium]
MNNFTLKNMALHPAMSGTRSLFSPVALQFSLFVLFALFVSCLPQAGSLLAQNPDIKRTYHWYFGSGAGLDFSSGTAVADTTGDLHTYEGCAVMSDTAGNLLFYTDGDTVWNKNQQPMPNGTGLMGCGNYGSAAQAALIIPHPGNDSLFYIFTNDCWENSGAGGFRYSIVNINLNSGLGNVTGKNNLLFAPSTEAVAATKHANGKDYWVITHEYNTNNFLTYKIDDTLGLITTPVISSVGKIFPDYFATVKFSSNGKKIATTGNGNMQARNGVGDFDNTTGHVSNLIDLHINSFTYYYSAFSSDNSKLYFTFSSGNDLFQYCLTGNNDSTSINNSMVWLTNDLDSIRDYGQMEIGLDGKIYIATLWYDSLSVIANPNLYGSACNILSSNLSLNGKQCELGISNFVDSYFYNSSLIPQNCDSTNGIFENTISSQIFYIYPNPASQIINLHSNISNSENATLNIYNLLGISIKAMFVHRANNEINISDIPNGIYIIKVETSNNLYSQKLVINH